MIGVCTDSTALLPSVLIERFCVEVVPVTIIVDGQEYLDGVDLEVDEFYATYRSGHRPTVEFATPSPGQFAAAYDDLLARGCTQIVSIHAGSGAGSMLSAARLAARTAPVPVRLVDSVIERFGIGCCVWAAGDAVAAGASFDEVITVAESMAPSIGNVFTAAAMEMLHPRPDAPLRNVLTLVDGTVDVVRQVEHVADAVNAMAAFALGWRADEGPLRVGVGWAHRDTLPIAQAVAHAIGESARTDEVILFRIGPGVSAESGPGTVGCVMYPV